MGKEYLEKPSLDGIDTLWNEYSHRHEHVWTWLYKLLIAVLALSIAPYLSLKMPGTLKWFLLVPPILSIMLLLLASFRVNRELSILDEIRSKYREWQRILFDVDVRNSGWGFTRQITLFYGLIWLAALINVIVSIAWITRLPLGCGD